MGRAEKRKQKKVISKKLTVSQYNNLLNSVNKEYIEQEVKDRVSWFKNIFSECLIEAFEKNNISKSKSFTILEDVQIIMQRKGSESKNE